MKMTHKEWEEKYKPIENPFRCGFLFETYGEELDFVIAHSENDPEDTVWTLCWCDDEEYVQSGIWLVNRDGYYITEIPCDINEMIVLEG